MRKIYAFSSPEHKKYPDIYEIADGDAMIIVGRVMGEDLATLFDTAPEMLEVLELIIAGEEKHPSPICPICHRDLKVNDHKFWCWMKEAIRVVKKARRKL